MTRQKSKISFTSPIEDAVPVQARRVHVIRADQDTPRQSGAETATHPGEKLDAFDDESGSLHAPSSKPLKVANAPPGDVPRAPGFAAMGLMADRQPGFMAQNARMLGFGGMVALTFVLGVASTVLWLQQDTPPQQASAAGVDERETFSEAPTRAEISDMTDVSEVERPADTMSAAILAGLQRATSQTGGQTATDLTPPKIIEEERLKSLRDAIVAGEFEIEADSSDGVDRVRLRVGDAPLGATISPDLVVGAGTVGGLEVPASMRTPEGGIDVETMIFSLVQNSLSEDPDAGHREAAIGMSRKIFAASNARTEAVDGRRIYTVRRGDSLAYIALQFYGRPDAFDSILEANRDTLQSPDEIQIGQRLIIPS